MVVGTVHDMGEPLQPLRRWSNYGDMANAGNDVPEQRKLPIFSWPRRVGPGVTCIFSLVKRSLDIRLARVSD